MIRILSLKAVQVTTFLIFLPVIAHAQTDCSVQARTDLEKLFCKVLASTEGRSLPSFNDFRRNSPKIQAALLKTPARRLNLTLPVVVQPKQVEKSNSNQAAKKINSSEMNLASTKSNAAATPQSSKFNVASGKNNLERCKLQKTSVQCDSIFYRLASNVLNKQLNVGALAEKNKMLMKPFVGDDNNEGAVKNYLAGAYHQYIEKMLEIGLGASTMSFTKFYYTFYELKNKKQDFSERFEKMYGFLKKDKATMAIKSKYTDDTPTSLAQCFVLSEQLIVCDNRDNNWVFVRDK